MSILKSIKRFKVFEEKGREILGAKFMGCFVDSNLDKLVCEVDVETPTYDLERFLKELAENLDEIEEQANEYYGKNKIISEIKIVRI